MKAVIIKNGEGGNIHKLVDMTVLRHVNEETGHSISELIDAVIAAPYKELEPDEFRIYINEYFQSKNKP